MPKRCTCPGCHAVFAVPATQLLPGRALRCFRCGESWHEVVAADQLPDVARAAPPPPAPPAADPPPVHEIAPPAESQAPLRAERPVAAARPSATPRTHGAALLLAWAVSLVTLLGGGSALLVAHREVAQIWPASLRLYRIAGLSG